MNEKAVVDLPLWSDLNPKKKKKKMCSEAGISPSQIKELISLLREYQHMDRARGIYDDMDICLSQGER